jgi:PadR family transcriptional regulator, regulatory protein PadR
MLDVIQGTLELLILRTVAWGPQHGFGIAKWIRTVTDGRLHVEDGALYPALHRMEQKKLIQAEWGITESGRRARYYALTSKGRKELRTEESAWTEYVDAVHQVLTVGAGSRTPGRSRA